MTIISVIFLLKLCNLLKSKFCSRGHFEADFLRFLPYYIGAWTGFDQKRLSCCHESAKSRRKKGFLSSSCFPISDTRTTCGRGCGVCCLFCPSGFRCLPRRWRSRRSGSARRPAHRTGCCRRRCSRPRRSWPARRAVCLCGPARSRCRR